MADPQQGVGVMHASLAGMNGNPVFEAIADKTWWYPAIRLDINTNIVYMCI